MLDTLRADWKLLKAETPGHRFQGLHEARAHRPGRSRVAQTMCMVIGVLLVVVSPVLGLIPGPGGLVVFGAGAAMLACEFHCIARALDWCEPKLRKAWKRVRRLGRRSPRPHSNP